MLLLKNSQQKQRYSNLRFRCYVLPFILLGREVFDATGTIFGLRQPVSMAGCGVL